MKLFRNWLGDVLALRKDKSKWVHPVWFPWIFWKILSGWGLPALLAWAMQSGRQLDFWIFGFFILDRDWIFGYSGDIRYFLWISSANSRDGIFVLFQQFFVRNCSRRELGRDAVLYCQKTLTEFCESGMLICEFLRFCECYWGWGFPASLAQGGNQVANQTNPKITST